MKGPRSPTKSVLACGMCCGSVDGRRPMRRNFPPVGVGLVVCVRSVVLPYAAAVVHVYLETCQIFQKGCSILSIRVLGYYMQTLLPPILVHIIRVIGLMLSHNLTTGVHV